MRKQIKLRAGKTDSLAYRLMVVKIQKIKTKKKMLKETREKKMQYQFLKPGNYSDSRFLITAVKARREWNNIFKMRREKNMSQMMQQDKTSEELSEEETSNGLKKDTNF